MNRKNASKRIAALLLTAAFGFTGLTGCSKTEEPPAPQPAPTQAEPEAPAETAPEETTEAPTEHTSPMETITASLGTQLDVNATLNRDSDDDAQKNYKAALSDLIGSNDRIDSFTFIFYAGDGSSNIGTYKGGCGISVSMDCPAATDEGWYQSDDFEVKADGAYVEVTWQVPAEIRDYISTAGDVQVGYWWGNVATVNLRQIICSYTTAAEIPVDGTETLAVSESLRHGNDDTNSVKIDLSDVLGENGVPQAITFDFSAGSGFGKFTGAFGITTDDWYQTDTIAVLSDSASMSLTWIIPDEIKSSIPQNAEVMLGYWWGEPEALTLHNITVKYSYGAGASVPAAPQPASNEGDHQTVNAAASASRIAADIKVGWNLGNTLDSYDDTNKSRNLETYWGNVKTTKAMIDAVKAKGFNAIRIPVSWANHLDSSNTIAPDWLDRVQEVVDYAMDNDLYVILNMHHDDYMWLHPVYAEEEAVTEKFLRVWEQIAERFKDYDTNLLFEGMNEPRMVGSANEWMGGTPEEHDVINHLLQKYVDLVRTSGGKNADRTLIVTTHAASITDTAVNGLVVPADDNLIVSIHNYAPWKFTTLEYPNEVNFEETDKTALDSQFAMLKSKFIDKGIPVIIGEFGAENKDNASERAEFYSSYVSIAARYGIPCFVWDNGPEDSFGLFDRKNGTWYSDEIMDALMAAVK